MNTRYLVRTIFLGILLPITVVAQVKRDVAPLTNWPAPLYWQPSQAESQMADAKLNLVGNNAVDATTPGGSLVFVGMTPCRVVDTRIGLAPTGTSPTGIFGAGEQRTIPIQSSTTCSIPSIARAYS